jgi:pyruvate/2-oxoglutarate dehydrogenase complex dihydrolipoamide dehydrogenase (E3) component
MAADTYDVIVIGLDRPGRSRLAGLPREACRWRSSRAGWSAASALTYACIPSNALPRPAQALAEVQRVAGAAQAVTGSLDIAAVLARRDELINGLSDAG